MRRELAVGAAIALAGLLLVGGALGLVFDSPTDSTQADTHASDGEDAAHDGSGMDGDHDGSEMGMMDMEMVPNGTIVNENEGELPDGCDEMVGEREVTVRGGVEHSEGGEMFAFDRESLALDPCTAVTVTFVNEDDVRHQWMIHGLSEDTYPMGMFNIEVNGPASVTATFVTPAEDTTLHTHCSLPQHEQKGMAMSVVVGDGGDAHGQDGGEGGDGHDAHGQDGGEGGDGHDHEH